MAIGLVAALIVGVLVAAPVSAEELGQVGPPSDEVVPVAESRAVGEASSVVSLVPARVLETRAGRPTADGLFEGIGRRSALQVTEVDVLDRVGVPASGVEAVVMNATAIGAVQRGFLTVFPCGERPEASSVNYEAGGPAVANEVIAKVSDQGTVCVFNQRDLDIVLDVVGYIGAADTEVRAAGETSSVVSLVPARVLETRADRPTADAQFEGIGRRSARQVTEVDVLDRVGVPAEGVEAVVMNATAIGAVQRGFLTVFPCGERPEASSVNYEAGGPAVANEVIAKVSDQGTVCVFNQRDLDIVLDVVGYIGAADTETRAAGEASSAVSLVPARVLETRADRPTADGLFEGIGRRAARQVTEVDVLDRVGVPAEGVEAVVMNATAIGAIQRGFLTVFPCGDRPEASSVNYEAGGPAVANEVIAKVSDQGTVCVFNQRDLDIVLDVVGYISSIPSPTDPPPVDPPPVDPPPPPPPPPDGDVVVPDVVGLQQGQAIERIVDETLTPGLGGSRHDSAPAGEVIEQTPIGGSRVDEGDDVAFVLSLGPELVTVPDVLGDDETTARSKIEAADLTVGDVGAGESDVYDVGDVNLQLPLAGQQVLPGTPVDVTLTTGLVNDPPEITTNPVTEHTVGTEYVYDVDATDPESDPITFVLQAGPLDELGDPLAQIDPTTGVLTWTPTTDHAVPVDFAIRAEDSNGGIDVQSFTLDVRVPNRPPVPEDDVYGVAINDVLTVDADSGVLSNDTDPDDDDLTAEIVDDPANGTVAFTDDGSFTYTPFQQISGGTRFPGIDLTRFSLAEVDASSTQSASFVAENLVDGFAEEFWVAAFGTTTAQITLTFDASVTPATLDLLGIRGSNADSGLGLREVDVTLLDADDNTVLSLPGQLFPPNDDGGDDVDADLTVDLAAAAGGDAPAGVRSVVIDIVDTDGGRPGLGEVVLTGDGPRRNLSPDIQWSWTDSTGNGDGATLVSPTVGDLDGDGFPEVLFLAAPTTNSSSSPSIMYVLDGRDGSLLWATERTMRSTSSPVLGDLDGDGLLEVVAVGSNLRDVIVFGHDGEELDRITMVGTVGNLALADLDADGTPEIVAPVSNQVAALTVSFDALGAVTLTERWLTPSNTGCGGQGGSVFCVPIVADVDLDGEPEIVAGNRILSADGSLEHDSDLADGFVAIGNFDDDAEAEIVHVRSNEVRLLNHDLTVVWGPVAIPEGGRGGPPTVGDYDSDGEPEIGVAGARRYFVLDSDGTELWQAETVDTSSDITGSTIFDFDNDGTTEVVYRDEQHLWIFNGPTGEVRYQTPIRSRTLIEYPIVADVDADGQAEIVITQDDNATLPDGTTRPKGLYVFEGGLDDWVRARSIWNQHSYHVTNINTDGTIPTVEPPNWLDGSLNNFRQQSFSSNDVTGLDSFTYRVADPSGASSDATAYVEIRPAQNDPVVTCTPPATATVGYDYTGRVCATDPDNDDLTFAGAANLAASAQIPARAHPWLAGQPDGAILLGDNAPDNSPVLVATDEFFAAGEALTFNVSGNAGTDFSIVYGPDGNSNTFFGAQNGLAGIWAPFAAPVGVFLNNDVPDPGSAPPPDLDFRPSGLGEDFESLSPQLGQPFFIGDGRTPDGIAQEFLVPDGASRLYVGVMDDNAWATNPGDGFELTVVSPRDAGIDVDPISGVVTWTPPTVGQYRFSGTVTDESSELRSTPFAQTITVAEPVEVPDVVGLAEADARLAVLAAGLRVGSVDLAPSLDVPADEVLEQFPPAGSNAARDARVAVTISSGSSPADFDGDSDGFTPNEGDCNDDDPAINPSQEETDGDGVDSNCDGEDDDLGVQAVGVTGSDNDLAVGRTRSFTAQALLADGRTIDITELATFDTSDDSIATIAGRTVTAVAPGAFDVTASYAGITTPKPLTVIDPLPTDDTPPVAEITAPVAGEDVSAEVDIIGTATDDNLTGWALTAVAEDGTVFTEIAAGTTEVDDGLLGTLATASVPAGVVTLRLDVEDGGGNVSRIEVPVIVLEGPQPGQFSMSFVDLTVPMSGIPISVIRTYDSRDRRPADFGAAWELDLSGLDLRVSPDQGVGWEIVPGRFASSALQPTIDHSVTITLPDGDQEVFDLLPSPRTSLFVPLSFTTATYDPRPGTTGTLVPTGNTNLLVLPDATGVQLVDDATTESYEPPGFVYTSLGGTAVTLDADGTITRIEDPNGNVITIGANGITHSAGKSVTFERDAFERIVSVTDPEGNVQTYDYSAAGDLVAHTDREGHTTTFAYDDGHYLTEIVDPLGRQAGRMEYDDQGRLVATIDAEGRRVEIDHDPDSNTSVATNSDGSQRVLVYDADGNVTQEIDELLRQTNRTFDDDGNRLSETDGEGRTINFAYDDDGLETSRTDGEGNTSTWVRDDNGRVVELITDDGDRTIWTRDAAGNVVERVDPDGAVWAWSYDSAGNMLTETDPNGNTTTFTYDRFGQLIGTVDPMGRDVVVELDASGAPTEFTINGDDGSRTLQMTNDANDVPLAMTRPSGATETRTVDAAGQVTAVTDAVGREVIHTYGDDARLESTVLDDGTTMQTTYDVRGRLDSAESLEGALRAVSYDAASQVTSYTDPSGALDDLGDDSTTDLAYDDGGMLTSITNPNGVIMGLVFDDAGRIAGSTDSLARTTSSVLDDEGRPVSETDALGRTTSFTYDDAGRVVEIGYADGTTETSTYDEAGNRLTTTDELGRTTSYVYDAAHRIVSITDPTGAVTTMRWTTLNRIASITDPLGRTTRFSYDIDGNLADIVRPDGATTSYDYDASGLPIEVTDPNGLVTTTTYDGLRRPATITYGDGRSVAYTYDDASNTPATVTDHRGTTTQVTDERGRVTSRTEPDGTTVEYVYDDGNRLVAVQTPYDRTEYTYDLGDRMTALRDATGTATFTYDDADNLLTTTFPNGVVETRTYDVRDRLLTVRAESPSGVATDLAYTYTPAGQVGSMIDAVVGTTTTYGYDGAGRLTSETVVGGGRDRAVSHTLDAVGNRIAVSDSVDGDTTFTYDARDRLVAVSGPGGAAAHTYDAAGQRISSTGPDGLTLYGWDAAPPTGIGAVTHRRAPTACVRVRWIADVDDQWGGRGPVRAGALLPVRRDRRQLPARRHAHRAVDVGPGATRSDGRRWGHPHPARQPSGHDPCGDSRRRDGARPRRPRPVRSAPFRRRHRCLRVHRRVHRLDQRTRVPAGAVVRPAIRRDALCGSVRRLRRRPVQLARLLVRLRRPGQHGRPDWSQPDADGAGNEHAALRHRLGGHHGSHRCDDAARRRQDLAGPDLRRDDGSRCVAVGGRVSRFVAQGVGSEGRQRTAHPIPPSHPAVRRGHRARGQTRGSRCRAGHRQVLARQGTGFGRHGDRRNRGVGRLADGGLADDDRQTVRHQAVRPHAGIRNRWCVRECRLARRIPQQRCQWRRHDVVVGELHDHGIRHRIRESRHVERRRRRRHDPRNRGVGSDRSDDQPHAIQLDRATDTTALSPALRLRGAVGRSE